MTKILVLGNNGMLGNAVERILTQDKDLKVLTTSRTGKNATFSFDVEKTNISEIIKAAVPDFVINCIGTIKPRIKEDSAESVQDALKINSIFPHQLSEATRDLEIKVIQIATDCVYSGDKGRYLESDLHDATDVYGKTKSLGEVNSTNFFHIRASIVGPELGRSTSLLEWFINQPQGAKLNGYANHMWNGVSTYQFAKISHGIIKSNNFNHGKVHLVPGNSVNKYELLCTFKEIFGRSDIDIIETYPEKIIDRTLDTENSSSCSLLWSQAGYVSVPSVEEMLVEMKELSFPR